MRKAQRAYMVREGTSQPERGTDDGNTEQSEARQRKRRSRRGYRRPTEPAAMSREIAFTDTLAAQRMRVLLERTESLLRAKQNSETLIGEKWQEFYEREKGEFHSALVNTRFSDIAALIAEAVHSRTKNVAPPDALPSGTIVQTVRGRYGEIIMHGFDAEGSFGYLVHRDGEMVFTYHGVAMQGPIGWRKQADA